MWPLDYGVLVERQVPADSGYDGFPTLFSLLHPVDDFSPVTSRRPSTSMHMSDLCVHVCVCCVCVCVRACVRACMHVLCVCMR